jgi:hypothetical protein
MSSNCLQDLEVRPEVVEVEPAELSAVTPRAEGAASAAGTEAAAADGTAVASFGRNSDKSINPNISQFFACKLFACIL